MDPNVKPGAIVELGDGRIATVRFVGETLFREGLWIGVELEDASGKNDGSVQGKRYFDCEPLHGMFLQRVSSVLEPAPAPKPKPKPAAAVPTAKSNGKPIAPLSRRTSSIQGPTKSATRPTSGSGTASPVKRTGSATGVAPRPRQSMAPPATRRTSVVPDPSPTRPAANRTSIGSALAAKPKAPSTSVSSTKSTSSRLSLAHTRKPSTATETPKKPTTSVPSTSTVSRAATAATNKQVEELEAKLRVIEKRRAEDRERLKDLERLEQEKIRLEGIVQKLQAKYQPQAQENVDLKRTLKEAESRFEELETLQAEHDSIMEMATLDKEMAEEQAEAYKTELDMVRSRLEELQLENEIMKEENEELGREMDPGERTSKGWLQMERENDRLRDALIRLRDMTQERESELREQMGSLQVEVEELGNIKQLYDDQKAKMLEAEADIDDLRQQLEAALGAEDIIEQLGEKNELLNEQVEELKMTIEDFESLKEVNDELEVNHIETEKQLQDEIDFKESQIAEQLRRATQQDEVLADQEYTITKFRELVTNMQTDLEHLRSSKEITDSEAQQIEEKSKEMMDLNRQLQQSAANSKIKTIDMELRKLEAQEASEHLAIVQLFLPDAFHAERDSVLALLRFKRVGFKATLLHGFIRDKVTGSDKTIHEDDVFDACDVLDKLTYVASMCDRFVNRICSCSAEHFAKFEGALYELEPIERSLNAYIEFLKKDELREKQVAEELHRSCAVIAHLAEYHLSDGDLSSYADEVLMQTMLTQSHLDSAATAISILAQEVQSKVPALAEDETEDDFVRFIQRAEHMISHSRSAKVIVGKAVRALQEMKARSLGLNKSNARVFEQALLFAEDLAEYTRKLGEGLFAIIHDELRSEQLTFSVLRPAILATANSVFSTDTRSVNETDPFATMANRLDSLTATLMDLAAFATDLDNTAEFEKPPAPWVLRSKELAAAKIVSVDAEEEMKRLREEVQAQRRDINVRKQELEERDVKIEVLEKRVSDAGKKAVIIKDLEKVIEQNSSETQKLQSDLSECTREMERLREEKERAILTAEELRKQGPVDTKRGEMPLSGASKQEVDRLKAHVVVMERTNQYLREANRRTQRTENSDRVHSWLRTTLHPTTPRFFTSREDADKALKEHATGEQGLPPALSPSPRHAFRDLTNLAGRAEFVALEPFPAKVAESSRERLKWRPRKETPQFRLEEQEGRWEEVWGGWESKLLEGRGLGVAV